MGLPVNQTSFNAGEISPALWGNVDFSRMHVGAATMRNFCVSYKGGMFSRAGTAFVGYSKQTIIGIATGSVVWSGNPSPGDTVTLNGVVFTFVASGGSGTNIDIGANTAFTIDNLLTALNASVNPSITVATYAESGGPTVVTLTITYKAAGTQGNTYTLAATGTGTPSGATLSGGVTASPPKLITFQFSLNQGLVLEFGDLYMRVISNGAYVTKTPQNITNITANSPGKVTVASTAAFTTGDWAYINGVVGPSALNGRIFMVTVFDATHLLLYDIFGNPINTAGLAYPPYVSGGTIGALYTLVTPYAAVDLKFLKFAQSADVMSLTLRNQETGTEYQAYDLARIADDNWTITALDTTSSIAAPANPVATANNTTGTNPTSYSFCVTAVNADDGQESVASAVGSIVNSVDISATAGSLTYGWDRVSSAAYYNVYQAPAAVYNASVPAGSLFGYLGTAYGNQFVNSNIIADFSRVPPLHKNPFARGQISRVTITGAGASIVGLGYAITTSTGSGAVLSGVVVGGALVNVIVTNPGKNYDPADIVTFTVGSGTPPTGTLVLGALTGTYPSVVAYFQERRVYANTANAPDTYFMSQPGAFKNFDSRIPTLDSDAIVGTPWSVQVDGIQFMLPLLGTLVALTGQAAYMVTGSGGSASAPAPVTPSSQQALPQVYNGCHFHVRPLTIDYDVYYLQAKGSVIRSLSYNFWINVLTGVDVTFLSSHLFTGYQINAMAWCEEPYRVLWAARDDGVLLSLTSMKTQDVMGWARHDTQGLVLDCTSVTEPPVDALYIVVQRFTSSNTPIYTVERMNDRIWPTVEDAWCVDCALQLGQSTPNANLTVTGNPNGSGVPSAVTVDAGGLGYSGATTASIVDPTGTGCTLALTINGAGTITAITPTGGTLYSNPVVQIVDPSGKNGGSGAAATVTLTNTVVVAADAAVFGASAVGQVIRGGGGVMQITVRASSLGVTAAVVSPLTRTVPGTETVAPILSGDWTLTTPATTIGGLQHLEGLTVTGLADGNVIPPTVVSAGKITLSTAASSVVVGLGFSAQMQTLYLEGGQPTLQGRRKKIGPVTYRLDGSSSFEAGVCQPDGSTLSPQQVAPRWSNLSTVDLNGTPALVQPAFGTATIANTHYVRPVPLYTGDVRHVFNAEFSKPGQAAAQQANPLPLSVLAIIREAQIGDSPEQTPRPRGAAGPQQQVGMS